MILAAALSLTLLIDTAPAQTSEANDPAISSARLLLNQCFQVSRSGRHNQQLRALRHLEDPQLRPVYEALAAQDHAVLQIHGILGLAEISEPRQIDLPRVAQLEDPTVTAEVLSAALESKLIGEEQVTQILAWPELDQGLRVIMSLAALDKGKPFDPESLVPALTADLPGRRGLAALILHQVDDPRGTEALAKLTAPNDDELALVRSMLLQTVLTNDMGKAASWAFTIAADESANQSVRLLALRTAMRFGESHANDVWLQWYRDADDDPVRRIRLALALLRLSPFVKADLFDPLVASDDALLAQIGNTGKAIASQSPDIADQVVKLVRLHHHVTIAWAIDYADRFASKGDLPLILLGVILAVEDAPKRALGRRLEQVVEVVQLLYEREPETSVSLLRPIIASDTTDPLLVQATLLGLARTQEPGTERIVQETGRLAKLESNNLKLLLLARGGQTLSEQQRKQFSLVVRGGGGLADSLRIQAAWMYLEQLGIAQQVARQVAQEHLP